MPVTMYMLLSPPEVSFRPACHPAQAVDADVDVVGVSSQAAGHRTLVPELMKELRRHGLAHVHVVVGGIVPEADHAALRAAGVGAIYGPGTRIPTAAAEMLAALGATERSADNN